MRHVLNGFWLGIFCIAVSFIIYAGVTLMNRFLGRNITLVVLIFLVISSLFAFVSWIRESGKKR